MIKTLPKFMGPIVQITKKGIRFITKNSNVLLTIVSTVGVVTTVWVTIHGTIKAVKLVEEKQVHGAKEVVKTVWKCYIPTIGVVLLTTTAILCNGKINAKKLAVLTSAYSGSVETIKKIEEKMSEQIGPKKTQKAIDEANTEIAKSRQPSDQKDIVVTGAGEQLFYCASTGQWFRSDWNGVELAKMKFQKVISDIMKNWGQGEWVPVREAQEALGLPVTDMGEYMGWHTDDFLDDNSTVEFIVSSDWMDLPWGREIVGVVRFAPWPINI